jgi:U3 small nucleolar RNA-associated protein 20
VPLRYFFGVLYENFKLIWTPVVELIQSYASSMKMNDFWSVFGEQLAGLSDKIGIEIF